MEVDTMTEKGATNNYFQKKIQEFLFEIKWNVK